MTQRARFTMSWPARQRGDTNSHSCETIADLIHLNPTRAGLWMVLSGRDEDESKTTKQAQREIICQNEIRGLGRSE